MDANMEKGEDEGDFSTEPFRGTCKELPGITKDLLVNLVFDCSVLAAIGDTMIVVGFTVFGPKYVENQFSISAGLAAALFGERMIMVAICYCCC